MKRKTLRRKRQPRKTRKRRGGAKLGEGGFGRVYAPGAMCDGTQAEVTKVLSVGISRSQALNMIKRLKGISAELKKIDPNQDFFLYPEFCEGKTELSDENRKDRFREDDLPISYNMKRADKTLREAHKEAFDEVDRIQDAIMNFESMEIAIRKHRPAVEALVNDTFLPMFKKIKELLDKLHSANILHGDMSAENVMVMKDGTYRLIDFDLSRINATPLEPFQKRQEMKELVDKSLRKLGKMYPDLYTRMVDAT